MRTARNLQLWLGDPLTPTIPRKTLMTQLAQPSPNVEQLRQKHYNATVTRIDRVHDDLAILRVRPDDGPRRAVAHQRVDGLPA